MLPTDKLESLSARYREIEELLCQPNVVSDAKRYTGLTKERAELQQVVEAYGHYAQIIEDLVGHKEALADPDLRDLAAEEIPALEEERDRLEASINLLLLPQDPNDERDTILEIRSGTGGEEAAL
ncbi:MAG: PCRF domain-containing protein, partial [Deltaproteobacteria bacterium]|nr:PCRF domain-containing protein [Deltaproteobacteria bacterium]